MRHLIRSCLYIFLGFALASCYATSGVESEPSLEETIVASVVETVAALTPETEPLTPSPTEETTVVAAVTKTAKAEEDQQEAYIVPATQVTVKSKVGVSTLAVCLRNSDGRPVDGVYVEVFSQTEDISGSPTYGERLKGISTDQTGCASFSLDAGLYIAKMDSFRGYYWGNMETFPGMSGLEVAKDQLTMLTITYGRLTAGFAYANGRPINGQYVEVWTQHDDVEGNPVRWSRVAGGSTDNRGIVSFELTPGNYIITTDFRGYNWGSATDAEGEANVPVSAGATTNIRRNLGALGVEYRDPSGNAAKGVYCQLYTQTSDVGGNPALGEGISSGYTDNTGRVIWWDLTQGIYAVEVGDDMLYGIPVEWGNETYIDGKKVLRVE